MNVNALSRMPLPVHEHSIERPAEVLMLEGAYLHVLLASVVAQATTRNPVFSMLRKYLQSGAEMHESELEVYRARSTQLSVQGNCILSGSRIVVPKSLQPDVLRLLHEGHPGIAKMKAVARSHIWRTSLDKDITATM